MCLGVPACLHHRSRQRHWSEDLILWCIPTWLGVLLNTSKESTKNSKSGSTWMYMVHLQNMVHLQKNVPKTLVSFWSRFMERGLWSTFQSRMLIVTHSHSCHLLPKKTQTFANPRSVRIPSPKKENRNNSMKVKVINMCKPANSLGGLQPP